MAALLSFALKYRVLRRIILLHELRIYHCVTGRLPDLLSRFETITLRLWEKHGIRQAGFWTTEIGPNANDLYYLLQWESLAEREEKWTAFATDPEWLVAKAKTEEDGPILESLSNTILKPTLFSSVQ